MCLFSYSTREKIYNLTISTVNNRDKYITYNVTYI